MGAATGATAGTGCAANNRVKLRLCFFAMSSSKESRHSVKLFAPGCICPPECRPNCNGQGDKGICLQGSPLGDRGPLLARDLVWLHLTFHSIPLVFIHLPISSRFGEAAHVLTPGSLTIIFPGIRLLILKSNHSGCHCNRGWGGGGGCSSRNSFSFSTRSFSQCKMSITRCW